MLTANAGGGTGVATGAEAVAVAKLPGSDAPADGMGMVAVPGFCTAGTMVCWVGATASAAGLSSANTEERAKHKPASTSTWRVAWAGRKVRVCGNGDIRLGWAGLSVIRCCGWS